MNDPSYRTYVLVAGHSVSRLAPWRGTIGSYNHGTMLNGATFANNTDEAAATVGASGSQRSL
eukprot:SAG25_NODE_7169_length_499_cov_1.380000_1_plen_61_part_01